MTLFDLDWSHAATAEFELHEDNTTLLFVLRGAVEAQNERALKAGDLLVLDRASRGTIHLAAEPGSRILVLHGKPLNEPVVAHGPFVMNTRQEIIEAITDYQHGKMGSLAPTP